MNKLFLIILLLAAVPSALAADPITDKIYGIVSYAEQYELGQITYPALKIYSNAIREDVREVMSEVVFGNGTERYQGISEEAAKRFFGEPTEYTGWVWVVNEEKEERTDKKMPRWEKVVFDGKKIQITFNAWPQIYKTEEGSKGFYWVDFQTRFKKQFNFDLGSMQSEIKTLALAYLSTKSGLEGLAAKLVEHSSMLQSYLEQNKENCKMMLEKFFTSEDKSSEQQYLAWETTIFEGERFSLVVNTRICESCEWFSGADMWIDYRFQGPGYPFKQEGESAGQVYTIEELRGKDMPALLDILKEQLERAKEMASKADKQDSAIDLSNIMENLRILNRAVSESVQSEGSVDENKKEEYISSVASILDSFGATEKSTVKELRYERRLVEDFVEKKESWCRQVQQEECKMEEGCINNECKFALGGDEECTNRADDDGDTLVDCSDPDCAKNCGKMCKDVCEEECWPCGQQCNNACKSCRDCEKEKGGGGECMDICQVDCWPCQNEKCNSQPFCAACNACNQAQQAPEESCNSECRPCNDCTEQNSSECSEACKPCVECKSPAMNPECSERCKKITEGYLGQFEACENLCKQKVAFYCSGAKQYSPCEDTTYICNGNMQVIPCEIFTCPGDVKQTVPCGQEAFCGENQYAEGEQCKCRAGYYDCDGDGKSCESDKVCGEEMEVCDDKQDNDNDLLVDCEDMMDCKMGMLCGENKVCFDGKCLLKEDANVSVKCKENEEYIGEECKCLSGYLAWQGKCVPAVLNATCMEGYNEVNGECIKEEEPVVERIPANITEEVMPGNVTEIIPEETITENATELPVPEEAPAEEAPAEEAPAEEGAICPAGYELKANGCVFVGDKVACADNEIEEAGKCISKTVFEGITVRPEETGKTCVLVSDCDSERAMCSNGYCKDIPQEIYDREYGPGAITGVIIPEQPVETVVQTREMIAEPEEEIKEGMKEEHTKEEMNQEEKEKKEAAPEPAEGEMSEEKKEEAETSIFTGAFSWLTGFASKEKECSSDEDCKENQVCDNIMGNCNCNMGWFDCNGYGDGRDSDGCESQDVTCGGNREVCPGGCNDNQVCNQEKGYCQCTQGFNDCDGNWMNGCESTKRCGPCKTDDDCSKPVCAEWGDNVLIKFGCVEGNPWKQENGVVAFSGGCNFKQTGKVDSYLNFDAWGDGFKDVESERMRLQQQGQGRWCDFELESRIKERKEIEKGLNQEFLVWYFDEYLMSDPEKWENRISGIYDIYWALVDNAKQTAMASNCIGQKSIPVSYNPIEISYESSFGKVHIWEERKQIPEFGVEALTPYMEIWIFPPKEILRQEILKAKESGYMPGPPEQRMQEIGPSASEKEELKRHPEELQKIVGIADSYGGNLNALLALKDGEEGLFYIKITINKDDIFIGKPIKQVDFTPDISVEIQLDTLYDIIKRTEQNGELQSPPWDKREKNLAGKIVDGGVIFGKVTGAIVTGNIKVTPFSAVPKILKIVKLMSEGGPEKGQEQ